MGDSGEVIDFYRHIYLPDRWNGAILSRVDRVSSISFEDRMDIGKFARQAAL